MLTAATAQTTPPEAPAQADCDAGAVAHLLPTSSYDLILSKASFRRLLDGAHGALNQLPVAQRADAFRQA